MSSKVNTLPYDASLPSNPDYMPSPNLDQAHSPLKVLGQKEMLRKFVAGEEISPIHLRIGITGACNMRCNFCNFHSENETDFYDRFSYQDAIPTDKCIALLRSFAANSGRAVTFCGSGESTVHSGYNTICNDAHDAGLRLGLITNGLMLHVNRIFDCVVNTHTWVRVGMNAGSKETFAEVTKATANGFAKILGSVKQLRHAAKDPEFRIGLNFVITIENHHELVAAARHARNSGAHYIRFEPEFYTALGHDTTAAVLSKIRDSLTEAQTVATDEFEVSIPKMDRGPMDKTENIEGKFHNCHYSRFVTAIGADGNLYPCPQVHLNSRYLIGNVIERGYENILKGPERAAWEAANPLRTDLCKTCFYRPQNELLEWLKGGLIDLEDALSHYSVEIPKTLHADFI